MAVVTTSQNITAVSYAAGEIITIRNGAVLTVSATPATRPGIIQCQTSGKLRVENASTTTPIVLPLQDMNADIQIEGNAIFEARGAMIEIGTGTGSVQSFDFSTLFSGALTDVTYVDVETASGSGNFIPYHLVEIASRYYSVGRVSDRGSIQSEYDSGQPVMFWNSDTRVLTTGNNTNGIAPPNGCKIRIPNILITNQDWQPDATLIHRIASEGTPTGGTFTITVINARTGATIGTTAAIAFNASSATIDAALETVLGAGTITSSGGALPTAVTLTLAGAYASTPLRFQVNSSVTGGTNSVIYSLENSAANMSLLDLNPSGTLDAEMCMFSRKIRQIHASFSSFRAVNVGFGGDALQVNNSNGGATLDHVSFTPNPYTIQAASQMSNVSGVSLRRKVVTTSGLTQTTMLVSTLPGLTLDEDTRHLAYGSRTSTAGVCATWQSMPPNLKITRPRIVGGRTALTNLINATVLSPRVCDHPGTAQLTSNAQAGIVFTNCTSPIVADVGNSGVAAPRNWLFQADAQTTDAQIYGGSYDGGGNILGVVNPNGAKITVQGLTVTNIRSGGTNIDAPASFAATDCFARKVFATAASGDILCDSIQGAIYDLVGCSVGGFSEVNASVENFVGGNFADLGAAPTTGHLTFGAFGRGNGMVLSGATFTDQIGSVYLPNNGDQFVATITEAHGITAFANTASTFIAESEGGFSNVWRILNDGGVTGGTFTLTIYDASNVLIGTTSAIAFSATTTTVDTEVEAVLGASTVTVSGSLAAGYVISKTDGALLRITVDGSLLTGGTKPGVANALGRHNVGVALGTALVAGTTVNGVTLEFGIKKATDPESAWSAYSALTPANLASAISGLSGYSAAVGLHFRLRVTAVGADEYRRIQQVSLPTTINPAAWTVPDASFEFEGPLSTDVIKVRRASDQALLYTFTGGGVQSFAIGGNFGVEVCFDREDGGGTLLMRSNPFTLTLAYGDNGKVDLFYGAEVQLAQSADIPVILSIVQSLESAGTDAAGIRAAIGMAAADLDTQLPDIKSGTGGGFKWPR